MTSCAMLRRTRSTSSWQRRRRGGRRCDLRPRLLAYSAAALLSRVTNCVHTGSVHGEAHNARFLKPKSTQPERLTRKEAVKQAAKQAAAGDGGDAGGGEAAAADAGGGAAAAAEEPVRAAYHLCFLCLADCAWGKQLLARDLIAYSPDLCSAYVIPGGHRLVRVCGAQGHRP